MLCPLCQEALVEKRTHGLHFWECPTCRAEVWPYDERQEKAIRKAMEAPRIRSKKRSGGRKRKYRKKPKYVPWYQRTL
ncbi:MAG: zf-TFIIB domain-containing protein [Desulfotomaculales bacterium]